ncbi:dihydroorotate oxidase B, catalytic subunit [Magnetococcus marinus MC-1]|uniref:Dihydroorotate dehydrogenase n=1 Tax=Magnetococcus marinus (strain ATCC BAA-1437 / JCM 17883 / MC-1) TaxID=156889 RepID=A0LD69_MAGMM|nr:dihydroorotate dehydrogenase [Magnetococcus marinus]ABK45912.1 dihydroorotate oxidase B, catalytic subunit [Magnetococcus marinus MC-1]
MTSQSPIAVEVAGIAMRTPLVLLSGCVAFGEELLTLEGFDFKAIGAICLKGTTLEPKRGNPPHRLAETPCGMLNAIGLQNPGARAVVDEILPRLCAQIDTPLIANISGSTTEQYGEIARIFDQSPVAAIEINISCPNVKEGGIAFGSDPDMAAAVVEEVRRATTKPIITKLSPNVTDITTVAKRAIEAGSDALSVINTLMGMAIDLKKRRPVLGNLQGGLSGPAVKPVALLKVWQTYQLARQHQIPIIGQGGIASADDVLEFFLVGASATGLCTSLFKDPLLPMRIAQALHQGVAEQGVTNIAQLTGTLKTA